jgi:hypothetical protein
MTSVRLPPQNNNNAQGLSRLLLRRTRSIYGSWVARRCHIPTRGLRERPHLQVAATASAQWIPALYPEI